MTTTELRPLKEAPKQNGRRMTLCVCSCGNHITVRRDRFRREGRPLHCGCKHTYREPPTYKTWQGMRQRCYNPRHNRYHRYGGRGIKVCERWRNSYKTFLTDMSEKPEGMSLDRYPNPDGNYEPGNCRWATKQQQAENKSNEDN